MKPSASLVSDLNAVSLKEEDLTEAIRAAVDAYEQGECHMMTGVITTMQLFMAAPDKARAVIFRLQALGLVIETNEIATWIRSDGRGTAPSAVQRALVSAAAEHPLSFIDGDVLFEKESFLRRVLELAEPRGNSRN